MGILIGIVIVLLIVAFFKLDNSSHASSSDEPYDASRMADLDEEEKRFNDIFYGDDDV
ncbi:MAG: hypothetical protein ACOC2X_01960 [Bacillota bacterium]